MYNVADFSKTDDIGVICRGKSISSLKDFHDSFDHCFLVGQHEMAMEHIGDFLRGKKIVQMCNKVVLKVGKDLSDIYGVRDIQLNFNSKEDNSVVGGSKLNLLRRCQSENPWAKVHLLPNGFKSRRSQKRWQTTGLMGVDLAAFFKPKNVHIFGIDFYLADYFCVERKNIKNPPSRSKGMIENLLNICKRDSDITFHIYTCHHKLQSMDNLKVYKV